MSWPMTLTISGEIFSAELRKATINPVFNEPEYSNDTPVTVFPNGIGYPSNAESTPSEGSPIDVINRLNLDVSFT
jgi:hypothetical protein